MTLHYRDITRGHQGTSFHRTFGSCSRDYPGYQKIKICITSLCAVYRPLYGGFPTHMPIIERMFPCHIKYLAITVSSLVKTDREISVPVVTVKPVGEPKWGFKTPPIAIRLREFDGSLVQITISNMFKRVSVLSTIFIQYIPRNMHTVFALLCFVVVIHWLIFPYPSGLLHWHCGNLTIAPVPAKQAWWIWINTSCEFIMNDCITTTKQSTTKPCAYFLGYTVYQTDRTPLVNLDVLAKTTVKRVLLIAKTDTIEDTSTAM